MKLFIIIILISIPLILFFWKLKNIGRKEVKAISKNDIPNLVYLQAHDSLNKNNDTHNDTHNETIDMNLDDVINDYIAAVKNKNTCDNELEILSNVSHVRANLLESTARLSSKLVHYKSMSAR